MPKQKRAAADEEAGDDAKEEAEVTKDGEDEAEEAEMVKKPKKRAKAKKEAVLEEPHVAHEGPKWMIHPPWLMYRLSSHQLCKFCMLFETGERADPHICTLDYQAGRSRLYDIFRDPLVLHVGKMHPHRRPRSPLLIWYDLTSSP